MTIYQDSKRIVGTNTDRVGITAVSGGWKEVGRTTLGSAGDIISVASLPDKRYYMVLQYDLDTGGNIDPHYLFNNDTGTNYAYRLSDNGGSDSTGASQTQLASGAGSTASPSFMTTFISNLSSKEKLTISHGISQETAGAGNAPDRRETTAKWANTSSTINRIDGYNIKPGSFDTGSEVVVLGWDPDDTHTDNFWEELASVDLSGGAADNLSSGTITAKKYLWYQIYLEDSGGTIGAQLTVNNDTSTNYTVRRAFDGGADATSTSRTNWYADADQKASEPIFINGFIINNSSNEKLIIQHDTRIGGVGAGTAPSRQEIVGKWANTSNQITEIDVDNAGTGDFGTKSIIKVWGSD